MGYSKDNSGGPIVVDLETCPLDSAADYVPEPDLEGIQAARNLKDPVKVAEDISKRRAEASAAHAEKMGKAALDFNLARIVAIAWSDGGPPVTLLCENEDEERHALEVFWASSAGRSLVGFRVRTFDAPMIMARSRYLDVSNRRTLDLGRYSRNSPVMDLWDTLTFGLSEYETTTVMPRGLKSFARRYGLTVDDDVDGKNIATLVNAGDWQSVQSHVESDVRLTVQLAQRLGVMRKVEAAVV